LAHTLDKPLPNPAMFDFGRCPDDQPLKVYVYPDSECSDKGPDHEQFTRIFDAMRNLPTATKSPNEACLLVPAFDSSLIMSPSPNCKQTSLQDLPTWHEGKNHLLFFFGDEPRLPMFADAENAIVAAASVDTLSGNWRRGHDISSGLFESADVRNLDTREKQYFQTSGDSMMKRPLLLSFAGKVQRGTDRDRYLQELLKLSMKPEEAIDKLATYTPLTPKVNADLICDRGMFFRVHAAADDLEPSYVDLLKGSVFTFCPEGDNKATNRVADALSFGSVPVIVSNGYELPFEDSHGNQEPWAIHLPEADLANISAKLREISDDKVMAMRQAGTKLFADTWSSPASWATAVLDVVKHRVHNHHVQLAESGQGIPLVGSNSTDSAKPATFTVDLHGPDKKETSEF